MQYSVVIPVYNSSKTLMILYKELTTVMNNINEDYEIIFVDDCSKDDSWSVLKQIQLTDSHVKIIRLANNVGQWMTTLAGISKALGKLIITIDDDLEYETNDIQLLIKAYQEKNVYIVYGIPKEKKNKNLSYKLFFNIRDRFLRIFLDKIQTESFKIFKRDIYLDEENKMRSHLHFEAYTKFTVAERYVSHVEVNYRSRYFGNSNHTLLMKTRIIIKYGIEYYKSPFKYPLYLLLLLFAVYFAGIYNRFNSGIILVLESLIAFIGLIIIGILGKYLSSLYFKLKGLPEYIIIEEY